MSAHRVIFTVSCHGNVIQSSHSMVLEGTPKGSRKAARGGHCVASAVIQMAPRLTIPIVLNRYSRDPRRNCDDQTPGGGSGPQVLYHPAPWDAGTCEPVSMLSERCWGLYQGINRIPVSASVVTVGMAHQAEQIDYVTWGRGRKQTAHPWHMQSACEISPSDGAGSRS